ncbi:hypothetical protein [Methylomonas sp. AM2-LC]|uniref:hypothetical protein n=1 Tax=Methylomonas sp. AM2-LC TaxID=3153301 RepID=UPI0032661BE4
MNCCDTKPEIKQTEAVVHLLSPPATPVELTNQLLVFTGIGAYLVEGAHTGKVYRFSAQQPEQWVDALDAESLVMTQFFLVKH